MCARPQTAGKAPDHAKLSIISHQSSLINYPQASLVVKLVHIRTGRVLVERLELARSIAARMRGLLGRDSLPPGGGMLIEPCADIHTFFMRFALDVLFFDDEMVVRKVKRNLKPWRLASCRGARGVVELPAGALDGFDLAPGDALRIEEQE